MQDYSKASFVRFLDQIIQKGLVNANTGGGWKAACNKVLEDVGDNDDVRQIDIKTAIVRYNNRHPGDLSPASLRQYEIRTGAAIEEFARYISDPVTYKPKVRARQQVQKIEGAQGTKRPFIVGRSDATRGAEAQDLTNPGSKGTATGTSLAIPFPLRPTFLAQVVIPRDMTKDEAKRLCAFIDALAQDKP